MAVSLSMVALGKDAKISGRAICDAWRTRWPRAVQPAGMEKKESTFAFQVDERLVAFGLMPAPIPGMTEGEQPAARTPFWPNAAADLRQHKRHVIVSVVGGADPIDEMRGIPSRPTAISCCLSERSRGCNASARLRPGARGRELSCSVFLVVQGRNWCLAPRRTLPIKISRRKALAWSSTPWTPCAASGFDN